MTYLRLDDSFRALYTISNLIASKLAWNCLRGSKAWRRYLIVSSILCDILEMSSNDSKNDIDSYCLENGLEMPT